MIWLCLKGALLYACIVASFVFWVWLLVPFPPASVGYGTPESYAYKDASATMMFGGLGMFVCLLFLGVLAWHYWPWR